MFRENDSHLQMPLLSSLSALPKKLLQRPAIKNSESLSNF